MRFEVEITNCLVSSDVSRPGVLERKCLSPPLALPPKSQASALKISEQGWRPSDRKTVKREASGQVLLGGFLSVFDQFWPCGVNCPLNVCSTGARKKETQTYSLTLLGPFPHEQHK